MDLTRQYKTLGRYKLDLLFVCSIIFNSYLIVANISSIQDLTLWDEANYLSKGFRADFNEFNLSPAYVGWYFLLSKIYSDPVKVFYLNCSILFSFVPILIFLYLRRVGSNQTLSFIASTITLHSPLLLEAQKVNLFAAFNILLGLYISSFFAAPKKMQIIVITLLIASLSRAEFYLSFFLALLTLTYIKSRTQNLSKQKLILISVLLMGIFTYLSYTYSYRSSLAFKQGFAVNYSKWVEVKYNPWTHYPEIIQLAFHNQNTTMIRAAFANPMLWLQHVIFNFKNYLFYSARDLLPCYQQLIFKNCDAFWHFVFSISCLLFIVFLFFKNKTIITNRSELKPFYLLGLMVLISTIFSNTFIFTLPRYLSSQNLILIIFFAIILNSSSQIRLAANKTISICISLLFALLLTKSYANYLISENKLKTNSYLQLVNELKVVKINKPITMLEGLGGICTYLDPNCKFLWIQNKSAEQNVEDFLNSTKINALIINDEIKNEIRFANDPYWNKLVTTPESLGFSKTPLSNRDLTLLQKTSR